MSKQEKRTRREQWLPREGESVNVFNESGHTIGEGRVEGVLVHGRHDNHGIFVEFYEGPDHHISGSDYVYNTEIGRKPLAERIKIGLLRFTRGWYK